MKTTQSNRLIRALALVTAARLLPLLLLLTLPDVVQAQDYTYTTNNDGTITITQYTGPGGAVVIPDTINGLLVTSIGAQAFQWCTSLTSVTIPNSVTSIGDGAFGFCTRLTAIRVEALNFAYSSVDGVLFNKSQTTLIQYPGGKAGAYTIPNGVTSIGDGAFIFCNLASVTIANSVTSIGTQAFQWCTSLTSVTIPTSVTSIGALAFQYCSSLTSVTILNSVTSIGAQAFQYCGLTSVTIGNGVTSIGDYAFSQCYGLTSVAIPNSVTNIGTGAFQYCGLTSVTLPNNLTSIGDGAFGGCSGLTSVTIPNSLKSIGDGAFGGCSRLTSVTIPNSVNNIGAGAFQDCGLTSVTIPNSVTSIGDGAFYGCTGLTSVTICNTSIGDGAFGYCTSLTSVTIGNGVTSIGDYAFSQCYGLTSVTIPGSVTTIGYGAFSDCSSLRKVYFQGNAPSADESMFSWDEHVTVYYLSGTTGWAAAFGGRPTVLWSPQMPYICTTNNGTITITGYPGLGGAVIIPDRINGLPITSIGDGAFSYDISLTSITIGYGVTSIGRSAFTGCTSLTTMTVDAANSSFSTVSGVLFNKRQTTLLVCPGGKSGSYTIPNGVTTIADSAFSYCSRLTSVTIPNSVTSIGEKAFGSCTSLIGVYLQGNAASVGSAVFDGDNNATVYYLSGTTGWGPSFGGLPTFMMYRMYPPYQVTTTSDDGPGSLRQTILNANANGGGDILFTNVTGTNVLLSALPAIATDIKILGLGLSNTVISGNRFCRVFDISGSVTCVLSGLTIRDGVGSGIRNSAGNLTVRDCDIVSNEDSKDAVGGGIYSQGTLVLNNVKVRSNYAFRVGGIYSSGFLAITNSEICGNGGDFGDGGIWCGGTSILSNVVVSDNFNNFVTGGGIDASGDLTLIKCRIEGNYADTIGGGIVFHGNNLYILNSVISENQGRDANGGGWLDGTNILILNSTIERNFSYFTCAGITIRGTATMSNCTVLGNWSGFNDRQANGIQNSGTLNLVNCTVSGNYSGHGVFTNALTFGINNSGTLSALHCTIAYNDSGVINSGTFVAQDTLIANNTKGPAFEGLTPCDFSGVLTSQGFNLVGNLTNTTVIGDTTGNICGVDPLLGPLQDNGGPTWTHALLPGSLAIDAGSSAGLTTDQRGVPRPYDVACIPNAGDGSDIGAYEWTPTQAATEGLAVQGYARSQIASMLLTVNQSGVANARPLAATLRAALASIDRGNWIAAANQLQAFENKANVRASASNMVVAQELVQDAQGVIDAVRCDGFAPKVHSVRRQPDGKVRLNFSALTLQAPIVEASTNLVDWEVIGVGLAQGNGLFEFEDVNAASFSSRFYRVK